MKEITFTVYERTYYQHTRTVPDDFDITDLEEVEVLWDLHGDRVEDAVEIEECTITDVRVAT